MNYDVFGIENSNIIQDEDNYYFFRALEDIDLDDNLYLKTYC